MGATARVNDSGMCLTLESDLIWELCKEHSSQQRGVGEDQIRQRLTLKHIAFPHSIAVLGRRRKKDFSNPLIKLFQGHVSKINIIPSCPRAISQTRL
jgi:hypothetical protein